MKQEDIGPKGVSGGSAVPKLKSSESRVEPADGVAGRQWDPHVGISEEEAETPAARMGVSEFSCV